MKQAVILLGGRGKRLKPLTDDLPKPMVKVNNVHFLDYLLNMLIESDINEFIFLCGYKYKKIIENYKNKNLNIKFIIGKTTDNPEKRLYDARKFLKKNFFLLYGDNFWQLNKELKKYKTLINKKKECVFCVSFSNLKGTGEYGKINNITYDNNFKVLKYNKNRNANSTDIGFFYLSKKIIKKKKSKYSFKSLIRNLIHQEKLYTYVSNNQYYYITNTHSLNNFKKFVLEKKIKYL